jgi:hypothetical protein
VLLVIKTSALQGTDAVFFSHESGTMAGFEVKTILIFFVLAKKFEKE